MPNRAQTPATRKSAARRRLANRDEIAAATRAVLERHADPLKGTEAWGIETLAMPSAPGRPPRKVQADSQWLAQDARRFWPRVLSVPETTLRRLVSDELEKRGFRRPDDKPLARLVGDALQTMERAGQVERITGYGAEYEDIDGHVVQGETAWRLRSASAGKRPKRGRKRQPRKGATHKQMEAYMNYLRTGSIRATAQELGVGYEAARKRINGAKAFFEAKNRSVRTRRLPGDRRGQVNIPHAD